MSDDATAPLLLDTVAIIFWHADSPRLPPSVRAVLLQSTTLLTDFQYVVEADGFRLLDLDAPAAVLAGRLPSAHRDPFDRLIAAQALMRGLTVATLDEVFAGEFGVPVRW